jgi:hypothetical protein
MVVNEFLASSLLFCFTAARTLRTWKLKIRNNFCLEWHLTWRNHTPKFQNNNHEGYRFTDTDELSLLLNTDQLNLFSVLGFNIGLSQFIQIFSSLLLLQF